MSSKTVSNYISSAREPLASELSSSVLIAEANHRIANNLMLIAGSLRLHSKEIRIETGRLTAEEACGILDEVSVRIEAVGRLHRLLAADRDGAVDLADYLAHITRTGIGAMSAAGDIALSVSADDGCMVSADHALQVGLVVTELVTNATKYAHPANGVKGSIELGCRERPAGAMLIWVADDGVGLPEGFDAARDGGLGMRTMRGVANQIGATLSFESSSLGLTVRLLTPSILMRRERASA